MARPAAEQRLTTSTTPARRDSEGPRGPGADDAAASGPRRTAIALGLCTALALAALGAVIWAGIAWGLGTASARDHDAALASARQAAVSLVSVNFETAAADVERVENVSTGEFADLFGQNADTYAGIVEQGKVISTGHVTEAGVQSLDGDDATVLTAISSKVQNAEVPQGETREYRVEMSMHYQDGAWKVSKMEFIP